MIATAIITAPRPKPTLFESITSYRGAGFTNRIRVFADGPVDLSSPDMIVIHNEKVLGNLRNWTKALQTLFVETEAPWLMVCEDDIVWAPECSEKLFSDLQIFRSKMAFQRSGAISLYCPIKASKEMEKQNGKLQRGWYGASLGKSTWGAQCLVFSRGQAKELLCSSEFNSYLNDTRWHKNVDALIGRTLSNNGQSIAYRIPCLVDHTLGAGNSSLGYPDVRPNLKTNYYTGRP